MGLGMHAEGPGGMHPMQGLQQLPNWLHPSRPYQGNWEIARAAAMVGRRPPGAPVGREGMVDGDVDELDFGSPPGEPRNQR